MNQTDPLVSMIITVTNDGAGLERLLPALAVQTYPKQQMELILTTTGQVAKIEAVLEPWQELLSYRLLVQMDNNLAAARNAGAAAALGQLLLFLGESVEPGPELVQAHVEAHQNQPGGVTIGACRFAVPGLLDFVNLKVRSWWEDHFYTLAQASHRFSYHDLLGGNFGLAASLLAQVGGFDPAFEAGAEYELGLRLLKANVLFVFAPKALAYYQRSFTLNRSFAWAKQEGRLEAKLGCIHPELQAVLVVAHAGAPRLPRHRYTPRLFYLLGFTWPALGDGLAGLLSHLLPFLERFRLRNGWRRFFCGLMMYWYWRGQAEALGREQGSARFRQGLWTRPDETIPEISLDLSQGLAAVEAQLDQRRPASAAIYYGPQFLGHIPAQPGAERLRGVHLRPILAKRLAAPLLEALAAAQLPALEMEPGRASQTGSGRMPEEIIYGR